MKINDCGNGELTFAQAKTIKSWQEQMNTMVDNMQQMFAQLADAISRPKVNIGSLTLFIEM